MKFSQVVRIAILLASIFAAGLVTGRVTAPKPRALVLHAGGRMTTSDAVLAQLASRLGLDAEQQRQFAPLMEELAGEISVHPPATAERLQIFRRYFPRMTVLLRPEQKPAFDRYVRDMETKIDQLIRNRNRRLGSTNSNTDPATPGK